MQRPELPRVVTSAQRRCELASDHVRTMAVASAAPMTCPKAEQTQARRLSKLSFLASAPPPPLRPSPAPFGSAPLPPANRRSPLPRRRRRQLTPRSPRIFLIDRLGCVCYFILAIGRSFLLCPDTLKLSLPPPLLHICSPSPAAPGHRQGLNLGPSGVKSMDTDQHTTAAHPQMGQFGGCARACVCVCVCVCACVCVCVCGCVCVRAQERGVGA